MAIFLIMDRNKWNLNTAKDSACYKLGDIVEVFEDDKPCVIPPAEPFYIVKITGLKKEAALKYMEPQFDAEGKMILRRLYHIPVDLIPKAVRDKVKADRYIEIPWTQARNYILDKINLAGGSNGND